MHLWAKKVRHPKVFISYSWTSAQHRKWVRNLAEKLCSDGVQVLIDIWNLKEGQDKFFFMEKMVSDSEVDRVLIISDAAYAAKANGRKGGVGDETQIVTPEIYRSAEQTKFLPIIVERDSNGLPCLPVYLMSRIYIDFSDDAFDDSYSRLLRSIWESPEYNSPALGAPPRFVSEKHSDRKLKTYARREDAVNEIIADITQASDILSRLLF